MDTDGLDPSLVFNFMDGDPSMQNFDSMGVFNPMGTPDVTTDPFIHTPNEITIPVVTVSNLPPTQTAMPVGGFFNDVKQEPTFPQPAGTFSSFGNSNGMPGQFFNNTTPPKSVQHIDVVFTKAQHQVHPQVMQIKNQLPTFVEVLQQHKQHQAGYLTNRNQDFQQLQQNLANIKQQLANAHSILMALMRTEILAPISLHALEDIQLELEALNTQADIFLAELQPGATQCATAIAVTKSPFPNVYMQKRNLPDEDALGVRVLTGSNLQIHKLSTVKANVKCHTPYTSKTRAPKPPLKKDNAPTDAAGNAVFKFNFAEVRCCIYL